MEENYLVYIRSKLNFKSSQYLKYPGDGPPIEVIDLNRRLLED
jgi:hypothetical protein